MEIFLLIVIVAVAFAAYVQKQREDKAALKSQMAAMQLEIQKKEEEKMKEHKSEIEQNEKMEQPKSRDLFLETLTKIGCQYEFGDEEENPRIFFAYQGEHFMVDASNERFFITIWDTHWAHVELYDVEELSRLRKAINGSNLNNSVTTIYTIDEEGGNVDVHCKSIILFIPEIPHLEDYLRMELNEFFRAHRFVGNEMAKLREQENAIIT